jgi:hypothetical protein
MVTIEISSFSPISYWSMISASFGISEITLVSVKLGIMSGLKKLE